MLQTYVEPASSERGSSAHLQLQRLEDVRMASELWETESNHGQQPLPGSPSDPIRAATSDTLQRAQGELSQHWLSLSSLHSDLSRTPREPHQEPHDDEPRLARQASEPAPEWLLRAEATLASSIASPTSQQSKAASEAPSGSANSVMQGVVGVNEAGVVGAGAVQQPQVAVPSDDQPTDTQRTFMRL